MSRRSAQRKRREQKVNPIYQGMTVIDGMSQPRSMPRNYKSYAREGYGGNDTLYKVVNYAIINGAAIPPVLYTDKSQVGKPDGKRIENHPLLDKLAQPNPEQSGTFFRKSIIGYFLIAGNAFIYANRAAKNGPPDELWTLPPDRVKPIPDQTRGIVGYQYEDWPAEKNPIPSNLISHIRTWNPEDPFFGMSPVQVAAIMIDQQTDARKWNLSLFQNFLKPPGAWTTTALLSPNERSKLEARINEKMAGFRNAGKVPVLDGALKFEPSAVNPSEMDWKESMKFNAGSIANVYNMPPQLIGDTSSTTYDNYEQAEVVSYTEFIFPTLDDVYDNWRGWLVPMYSDLANSGAYLYYDKESVEVVQKVIQARKDAQADRANKMWMSGLGTLNECREKCGLEPIGPDGDLFRFGAILVRKSSIGEYADQSLTTPAAPPSPMPEPITQPSPTQPPEPENPDAPKPDEQQKNIVSRSTKALDLKTAEEKAAYAQSVEATRQKYEKQYEKEIASYFENERNHVVLAIQSGAVGAAAGRAEGAVNDQSSKLQKILLSLYEDVAIDVGGQVTSSLSGKKAMDFTGLFGVGNAKLIINMISSKVQQIISTTISKLKSIFSDSADATKDIDSLYNDQFIPNRSGTIAEDIAVGASNWATVEVAKQSDKNLLQTWLSQHDDKVRPAHADADGQSVPVGKNFVVGGEELAYPGDPAGSPENTIGCRCFVVLNTAQDEKYMRRENYRKFMNEVLA